MTGLVRALAVVAAACVIAGCGTAKAKTGDTAKATAGATPLPERLRRQIHVVRVAVVGTAEVEITGAAKGGVSGMGRGAAAGAAGANYREATPITALIGAVAGAIVADSPERVEAEESALRESVVAAAVASRIQAALVRQIRERSDVGVKVGEGGEAGAGPIGALIEVAAGEFQLVGDPREVNPDLAFRMRVTTRLVGADGNALHEHEQYWIGVRRSRRAWLADKGGALQQEIGLACEVVAERIVDDLFVVLPTATTLPVGRTLAGRLPPENPRDPSLRPTLRWEPFSQQQLTTQDGVVAPKKVQQVTYELRLWGRGSSSPIYTRDGLAEPSHTVEVKLDPLDLYRWSVRARMAVDDAMRVTPWSPYWFKTPPQ